MRFSQQNSRGKLLLNHLFFKRITNKISALLTILFLSGFHHGFAYINDQDTIRVNGIKESIVKPQPAVSFHAPSIYLDCRRCDYDFIRTELNFVNYVRDPELADIHIFVTDEQTGGGGYEFQFSFIGRRQFKGTSYSLKHYLHRDATLAERRNALQRFLKMGVASFMLQTPLGTNFMIEYLPDDEAKLKPVEDPWNYWVFQGYLGSVRFHLESNQSNFDSRWGFYSDRVTEKWKFRIRPYFNYGRVRIQTSEADKPVIREQRRHGLDTYAIKSVSEHWSAGLFFTYFTNNGSNIRHRIFTSPGIEYSILPYSLATRQAITFTYQFGWLYYEYFEETIYDRISEKLFNHQFRGVINVQQPWGSIETGLVASQFLHNPDYFRVEFFGQTSLRLFEGFSLSFQIEYDVIRDQLSLPKGKASLEDVLLKRRELATDFSFVSSIAISYTFGSRFANVVNTRF